LTHFFGGLQVFVALEGVVEDELDLGRVPAAVEHVDGEDPTLLVRSLEFTSKLWKK
jgi:hypothetical protein